jgi:hypothetical protein
MHIRPILALALMFSLGFAVDASAQSYSPRTSSVCAGSTVTYFIENTQNCGSNTQYSWNADGGDIINWSNVYLKHSTWVTVQWYDTGYVRYALGPGCAVLPGQTAPADSYTWYMNVTPLPGMPQIQYNGCSQRTLSLSAVGATSATSYTWTVPAGWTVNSGQGTSQLSVTTAEGQTSGTVCVQANNVCGSSSSSCLQLSCC